MEDSSASLLSLMEKIELPEGIVNVGTIGQGPDLILIHGTPWSSYSWRKVIAAFSGTHRVLFFDLLGFGGSRKSVAQDVGLAVQARVLKQLVQRFEIHSPVIVGHDIGGGIALRAHVLENVECRRMVLIDPVILKPWGSPFFSHVKRHATAFWEMPDVIHEAIIRRYIQTALITPLPQEIMDKLVEPWLGADGKAGFYQQIRCANEEDTEEVVAQLGTITRPVHILWGDQDPWVPVDRAEKLRDRIPGSEVTLLPGVGHLVQEEAPSLLVHLLKGLVRSGN